MERLIFLSKKYSFKVNRSPVSSGKFIFTQHLKIEKNHQKARFDHQETANLEPAFLHPRSQHLQCFSTLTQMMGIN
jgi:hypothetical protein